MGAGKTTIGKKLAEKLNYNFLDTDELIEQKENKRITEIFAASGENYFRKLETGILLELSAQKIDDTIISTGGGIIIKEENIEIMKNTGKLVYLKASIETIIKRANPETRPLLKGLTFDEMFAKIKKLLALREEKYYLCDYIVAVDNLSIDEISTKIIDYFKLAGRK